MRRQKYDYSGFSLRRLNEPYFAHIKLLGAWPVYFAMYFFTENLIPAERCHVIHGFLDDVIPFSEVFVIFYVSWFLFVAGSVAYTFFYKVDSFRKLQIYIIITQVVAMLCYILYPSIQHLRPEVFPRQNVFTWVLGLIYALDTPTGVCPSLHVGYSLGILSASLKDKALSQGIKTALAVYVLMVCLAVCFVKQHSSIDVLAALPMCLLAEIIVYGRSYWLPKWKKKKSSAKSRAVKPSASSM